ncbi:unnamed protein product, partial [Rotaria sp. Silwood1]
MYQVSEEIVLLTSLTKGLCIQNQSDSIIVCHEKHGRFLPNLDLTSTVGWLTNRFPIRFHHNSTGTFEQRLKEIERCLSSIPNNGLTYAIRRRAAELEIIPLPSIMFVYLGCMNGKQGIVKYGQNKTQFQAVPWIETILDDLQNGHFHRDISEKMEFELEIIAWIHNDQLKMGCLFYGDNTLWSGEAGSNESITITNHHLKFQTMLKEKKSEGFLLVLCSKNNLKDIQLVFERQKSNMALCERDFVIIYVDWENKFEHVHDAAKLLNLPLNSFIFIDDSRNECEEMITMCPEVLTLQFPGNDPLQIDAFIDSLWCLDINRTTIDSNHRTELYRNKIQRLSDLPNGFYDLSQLEANHTHHQVAEMLRSWNMQIFITHSTVNDIRRLSRRIYDRLNELLIRTNQFRLNNYINDLLDDNVQQMAIWICAHEDKYGSEGVCFAMIFKKLTESMSMTSSSTEEPHYTATQIDEYLARCWVAVLKTDRQPSDDDNFVHCGGSSFHAVFLIARLRRLGFSNITLGQLRQHPTYGKLKDLLLNLHNSIIVNPDSIVLTQTEYPLSMTQMRFLLLQRFCPESTKNIETIAVMKHIMDDSSEHVSPTNVFASIIARHPILSSTIVGNSEIGFSTQVDVTRVYPVMTEEVTHLKEVKRKLQMIPIMSTDENTALICCRHFRLQTPVNVEFYAMHIHHILIDDVSLRQLENELLAISDTAQLERNIHPFDRFINEEVQYIQSENYQKDRAFWCELFCQLPYEFTQTTAPLSCRSWNDTTMYPANFCSSVLNIPESIEEFCMIKRITPFQYFLTCYLIVLQRYVAQKYLSIVIPITLRTDQYEHTIGPLLNTLLIPFHIDLSQTYSEFIEMIVVRWLDCLDHGRYSMDHLFRELRQQHDDIRMPSWTMFNYTELLPNDNRLLINSKHAKMPLSLDVIKHGENFMFKVEWADDLVPCDTANRLLKSYLNLCSMAYKNDTIALKDLDFLSNEEQALLIQWSGYHNMMSTRYESTGNLLDIFEEYVQRRPHAIAIEIEEQVSITYDQLDSMSMVVIEQLLTIIANQSSIQGRSILLAMKKDAWTIAAILAVWKLGSYFIPVGIQSISQINKLIENASPVAVISNISNIEISQCPLLKLCSNESNNNTVVGSHVPWNRSHSDCSFAYAMFTSGTTGTPKECRITHDALISMAHAWRLAYKLDSFAVRMLQWAPFTFDVFMGDFVRALISVQGTLILFPDEKRLDVNYVSQYVHKKKINVMEVTPQYGLELIEFADEHRFEHIKLFILGSDVLPNGVFQRICSRFKTNQRVLNSYGMTEATIDSCFFEGSPVETESGLTPIGKPLPGVCLFIIDPETLNMMPIGTSGELCIAGRTLAQGDAQRTELHFSFGNIQVLRTGDRARWLPTGDIELYGRFDSLRKIRGFRINTGDIANKIQQYIPGILKVYVMVHNARTISSLYAFIVAKNSSTEKIDRSLVHHRLVGIIPEYMIPDVVKLVSTLPLSSNGKIDERTLQHWLDQENSITSSSVSCPQTETMRILLNLLAAALKRPVEQLNLTVPFVDQGAHSLIIVRFKALLHQKTNFNVTISDLFTYSTIESLAVFIDRQSSSLQSLQNSDRRFLETNPNSPLAIVGVSIRLPATITTLAQLWTVLDQGTVVSDRFPNARARDVFDCLHPMRAARLQSTKIYDGAFLERIDLFDNEFFGISPGEAKFMLPEQRLFMETGIEALFDSGLLHKVRGQPVGIYAGVTEPQYAILEHTDEPISVAGLMPAMIPTRLTYYLDLKGPSMLIDTACSSSLVALQKACDSIQNGECNAAIVAGISITLFPERSGVFGNTSILAPDFICRAFDSKAAGTASGEGVLCIVIEPYANAIKRGQPIYALIHAVASNCVGKGNGITAPTSHSQAEVIQSALRKSNLSSDDLSYVEAH